MPTSITHRNLLSRAFSILLLLTGGLKSNQLLTRLIWVLILVASLTPALPNAAAQAANPSKPNVVWSKPNVVWTHSGLTAQTSEVPPITFPADGVYLYGQSTESGQIGSAYVVFETRNASIVGALYMPHSSFDCFYGGVEANQLSMTVISSYDREVYPYSIAIQPDSAVVDASGSVSTNSFTLEGFHQIDTLGEMDQHVLGVCRAEYPDQAW